MKIKRIVFSILCTGFSAQYINAELSNAIDQTTILFSKTGSVIPTPDATVDLKGDSWSWGYNVGGLYEFSGDTRVGVAYRSPIKQGLEGSAFFSGVSPLLASTLVNCSIRADLHLPDTLSLSTFHRFNKEWAISGDITRTGWDSFNELRVRFSSGLPDAVESTQWKNSWRYAAGVMYSPGDVITYRAGVAYENTPIPDSSHLYPRIPDGDRTWLSAGVGYKLSDNISADFGYAHLFVNSPKISMTGTGVDALRGTLNGAYDAYVNIVSFQLTAKF